MAGFQSALAFLPVIKEGVSVVSHALSGAGAYQDYAQSQNQALRQLKQRQDLAQKQQQADNALTRQQLAAQAQTDEDARRAALRRAVARQKAAFGVSGTGSSGGSAQAVLLGLFDETQQQLDDRARIDTLRNQALDLAEENTRSLNVLQRTQLQERAKIGRLSSASGIYSDLANSGLDAVDYSGRTSTLF